MYYGMLPISPKFTHDVETANNKKKLQNGVKNEFQAKIETAYLNDHKFRLKT